MPVCSIGPFHRWTLQLCYSLSFQPWEETINYWTKRQWAIAGKASLLEVPIGSSEVNARVFIPKVWSQSSRSALDPWGKGFNIDLLSFALHTKHGVMSAVFKPSFISLVEPRRKYSSPACLPPLRIPLRQEDILGEEAGADNKFFRK